MNDAERRPGSALSTGLHCSTGALTVSVRRAYHSLTLVERNIDEGSAMPEAPRPNGSRNPFHRLSRGIFCSSRDVEELSYEQQLALHEFFHRILAEGYKLYQTVPR